MAHSGPQYPSNVSRWQKVVPTQSGGVPVKPIRATVVRLEGSMPNMTLDQVSLLVRNLEASSNVAASEPELFASYAEGFAEAGATIPRRILRGGYLAHLAFYLGIIAIFPTMAAGPRAMFAFCLSSLASSSEATDRRGLDKATINNAVRACMNGATDF